MSNVLSELIEVYWDNPVAFAEDILNFNPDKWQREVMMDIAGHPRVSVRSGQGVGKTGLESAIALWYLTCRPFPKVIATAPTRQQLHDVLWAEISKWLSESKIKNLLKWTKTRVVMQGYGDRWFATARTATRPENMQGFHEEYMLFIVDEASGVDDKIMEAILGTLSGQENKLLMCGNPTKTSGVFYDSHKRDRERYKSHKVSSRDSIRTNKENIKAIEDKYGIDSDVVRVRVEGEFPKAEPDSFIPLDWVERNSLKTTLITKVEEIDIGVDVARYGDDQSVICPTFNISTKAVQQVPSTYNHNDTMQITGHVVSKCKKLHDKYPNVKKINVKIDCDGLGVGVFDRLREISREEKLTYINPIECHFGGKGGKIDADDPVEMANSTGLMWGTVREKLRNNSLTLIYNDKQISQISNRKYKINSKGQIELEKKEDMKKRGLQSPDMADALGLCFYDKNNKVKAVKRL